MCERLTKPCWVGSTLLMDPGTKHPSQRRFASLWISTARAKIWNGMMMKCFVWWNLGLFCIESWGPSCSFLHPKYRIYLLQLGLLCTGFGYPRAQLFHVHTLQERVVPGAGVGSICCSSRLACFSCLWTSCAAHV